jgi:hypothetical protein
MKPKHYLALFVLLVLAVFAGRSFGPGASLAPLVAEAQERGRDDDEREALKWEYCAVTKAQYVGSIRGGQYWISYFRKGNVQVETVEASVQESAVAKAVSKLGEEGWEMVGEGPLEIRQGGPPGGTPTALYFKRRKAS